MIRRDAETILSDGAKPEQKLKAYSNADPTPSEGEIIQPKQGIWRTYDATNGLPGGVWRLFQDRRGFLWLGTEVGLCRYDGTEFITYTTAHGLAHNYVYAICEDREGRLWFGTRGGGVSCFDGQSFVNYTTEHGLADNYVSAAYEDSQGRLWFGTDNGVSCFDGQGFMNYTTRDGLGHDTIQAVYEDSEGRLWFGTGWWDKPGRGVSCFDGQRFITYTTENGLPYDSVMAICGDRQGHLWFATCGGGISCFDGQEFTNYTIEDGLVVNHVLAICEDRQGNLWFGAFGGVSRFDGQDFVNYTAEDGLLDNRVLDIIQDREGHLWFANFFGGLTRLDTETLQLLTEEPVSEILIQDKQGGLWFGHKHELCYLKEGRLRHRAFAPITLIYCLLEDSSGGIWVGPFGDGLYYFDSPDAVWCGPGKQFTTEDGLSGKNAVLSLIETRDGTIWAGTEGTLWAETENRLGCLCRAVYSEPFTRPDMEKIRANTFEAITTPYGYISRLYEDSQGRLYIGGSVWAGGGMGGGIYRYDGKHFQMLTTRDGLPSNSITGLVPQPDGSMIIGTHRGIVRYHPTAIIPPLVRYGE